jgi:hypothetical protein
VKSKQYFLESVSSYSWRLSYSLERMRVLSPQTPLVKKYTDLLQEQLDVLSEIQ